MRSRNCNRKGASFYTPFSCEADLLQYGLNLRQNEAYECGALFLTVLAYPSELDSERSFQLYLSLCARALWLAHARNPNSWAPIIVKPAYVFRDTKEIDRDVAIAEKRLQVRMVAGRMAMPFFQIGFGKTLELPGQIKRPSLNQMAEFVQADAGQSDAENVEARMWRPSRSVIHLAAAALLVGRTYVHAGLPISTAIFLTDRDFLASVLATADDLAALVDGDPSFPVKAEILVRLNML